MTAIILPTSRDGARFPEREQLTEEEANQLRAMLARTAASTVLGALAILCHDQYTESLKQSDTCSARHWNDTASSLWIQCRLAFNRFGVGFSG